MKHSLKDLLAYREEYEKNGFLNAVNIMPEEDAKKHANAVEVAEKKIGPLHYKPKMHTLMTSAYDIATSSDLLDVVEAIIGPDILLYNTTYIIKEPYSKSHVSWHQDLTYWGFEGGQQISAWVALTPATKENGCMRMIPSSHTKGHKKHHTLKEDNNILLQGQTVFNVDEEQAVYCPLQKGEASFHHGWTLHSSMPNKTDERRIGLNIQYITPDMKQVKNTTDSAILLRGQDIYDHFKKDKAVTTDFDQDALEHHLYLEKMYKETAGSS